MQLNQQMYNLQVPYYIIQESAVSLPYVLYFTQNNEIQFTTNDIQYQKE